MRGDPLITVDMQQRYIEIGCQHGSLVGRGGEGGVVGSGCVDVEAKSRSAAAWHTSNYMRCGFVHNPESLHIIMKHRH